MPFPTAKIGDPVVYFDGVHKFPANASSDDSGSGIIQVSVNMEGAGSFVRVVPYDASVSRADSWSWISTSAPINTGPAFYDIRAYGAVPGAAGQTATTAAFNTIFGLISTSYPADTGGLMAVIYVPAVTEAQFGWYVGDLNPYFGNTAISLYMFGDAPSGYGAQGGSLIYFQGTTGNTMFDFVAINDSTFENLTFRGGTKAKVLIKLRQFLQISPPFQSASNGVIFINCFFCEPENDYNSILVQAGEDDNPPNTYQAADYHFYYCYFQGLDNGPGFGVTKQGWGFKAVVGGNTKTFSFTRCVFTQLYRGVDASSGYVYCVDCEGGNIGYDRDDQAALFYGNATGWTITGFGMENGTTGYHAYLAFLTEGSPAVIQAGYFAGTTSPTDYGISAGGPSTIASCNFVNSRTLSTYIAWAPNYQILVGQYRTNDSGKYYVCTQAGQTASSGGPTGTGTGIVDNTAKWDFVTVGDANVVKIQSPTCPSTGFSSALITGCQFPYISTPILSVPVFDGSNNPVGAAIGPNNADFSKNFAHLITAVGNRTGLFGSDINVPLPDFFGVNPIFQNDQLLNDNNSSGLTVNRNDGGVYIVTAPAAAIAASAGGHLRIGFLPNGFILEDAVIDVTTGLSGSGVSGIKLSLGTESGTATDFLDAEAASSAGQIGVDETQRGTAWNGDRVVRTPLNPGTPTGDYVHLVCTVTGGAVSGITAGSATVYLQIKRWRNAF